MVVSGMNSEGFVIFLLVSRVICVSFHRFRLRHRFVPQQSSQDILGRIQIPLRVSLLSLCSSLSFSVGDSLGLSPSLHISWPLLASRHHLAIPPRHFLCHDPDFSCQIWSQGAFGKRAPHGKRSAARSVSQSARSRSLGTEVNLTFPSFPEPTNLHKLECTDFLNRKMTT